MIKTPFESQDQVLYATQPILSAIPTLLSATLSPVENDQTLPWFWSPLYIYQYWQHWKVLFSWQQLLQLAYHLQEFNQMAMLPKKGKLLHLQLSVIALATSKFICSLDNLLIMHLETYISKISSKHMKARQKLISNHIGLAFLNWKNIYTFNFSQCIISKSHIIVFISVIKTDCCNGGMLSLFLHIQWVKKLSQCLAVLQRLK